MSCNSQKARAPRSRSTLTRFATLTTLSRSVGERGTLACEGWVGEGATAAPEIPQSVYFGAVQLPQTQG